MFATSFSAGRSLRSPAVFLPPYRDFLPARRCKCSAVPSGRHRSAATIFPSSRSRHSYIPGSRARKNFSTCAQNLFGQCPFIFKNYPSDQLSPPKQSAILNRDSRPPSQSALQREPGIPSSTRLAPHANPPSPHCSSFVFRRLRIAFFPTPFFSKTSALPYSIFPDPAKSRR